MPELSMTSGGEIDADAVAEHVLSPTNPEKAAVWRIDDVRAFVEGARHLSDGKISGADAGRLQAWCEDLEMVDVGHASFGYNGTKGKEDLERLFPKGIPLEIAQRMDHLEPFAIATPIRRARTQMELSMTRGGQVGATKKVEELV
jgi:hypothetical protein